MQSKRNKNGSRGMLPRKIFEIFHTAVAILVSWFFNFSNYAFQLISHCLQLQCTALHVFEVRIGETWISRKGGLGGEAPQKLIWFTYDHSFHETI